MGSLYCKLALQLSSKMLGERPRQQGKVLLADLPAHIVDPHPGSVPRVIIELAQGPQMLATPDFDFAEFCDIGVIARGLAAFSGPCGIPQVRRATFPATPPVMHHSFSSIVGIP